MLQVYLLDYTDDSIIAKISLFSHLTPSITYSTKVSYMLSKKRKVKSGFNAFLNQNFSLQFARVVLLYNTWVLFLMLLKSGDVHPNAGSNVSSESSFTSSVSDISGASALKWII